MKFGALTLLGIWIGTLAGAIVCIALKLGNLSILYSFIPAISVGIILGSWVEARDKR